MPRLKQYCGKFAQQAILSHGSCSTTDIGFPDEPVISCKSPLSGLPHVLNLVGRATRRQKHVDGRTSSIFISADVYCGTLRERAGMEHSHSVHAALQKLSCIA